MQARAIRGGLQRRSVVKPMTSQVNWALLGLLIERPGYGYQLMQRFQDTYLDMLPIRSESHIYTALDALEARGLIEEMPADGDIVNSSGTDRQPRVCYRATLQGVRAFTAWMLTRVSEDRRQSRLFIRQLAFFAHAPEVGLEIVEHYAQARAREARETPIAAVGDADGDVVHGLASRLLAEDSRLAMEGRMPWADFARQQFRALMRARRHGTP